jgi:hypothetical protein
MASHLARVRFVLLVATLVSVPSLATAPTVSAVSPFTFYVTVGSCGLDGTAPSNTIVKLTLRNPDGAVRARATVHANENGNWSDACLLGEVRSGDTVKASANGSSRQIVIPPLTVAGDRDADTVTGRAPAGTHLHVGVTRCSSPECVARDKNVIVGASARFDVRFAFDTIGGDVAYARFARGPGDFFTRSAWFPYLDVNVVQGGIAGGTSADRSVSATIWTSGGVLRGRASAVSEPGGKYAGTFVDAAGSPVYPRAGDRVESDVASGAHFTIPSMSVSAVASTDVISAHCRPDHEYFIDLRATNDHSRWTLAGRLDAAGDLTTDVTGDFDVRHGTHAMFACLTPDRDRIITEMIVP